MSNELINKSNETLPAYLQKEETIGVDELSTFVQPSRIKIVQSMSKAPFNEYNPGTLVVVPQMMVFADCERGQKGTPFRFVPIMFYVEYIQTNPLGMNPFVRQRSTDPKSDLARKAKNSDTWFETHPDDPGKQIANRECLNFIVVPVGSGQFAGMPMVLTFSKANYRDGSNLASMIQARGASIFAQVFEAQTATRSNDKGEWYGLDLSVPQDQPWVPEENYEEFKQLHLKLKEISREGGIQVDYEDAKTEEVDETTEF